MCGIAGIFNRDGDPVSSVILGNMIKAQAHRGPDGEGDYVDGCIGLGHSRLAILDLSPAGRQPMITSDGRFVLTYNGEIYNFRTLRTELESLGHIFHSQNDAEVVLHSYAQWGEKALDRFNGMYAFGVWDRKDRELFLARDRYGIKPVYYTDQGQSFLFASEVKGILANPSYQMDLDLEALLEYFTFQNLFGERTLFSGVKILQPGTSLRVRLGDSPVQIRRYWDYHFREPEREQDEREYIEELDRLFRQAVSRQLVADVEVGSYLSGGMDSGSITAIAATQLPCLKTFTCGFDLRSASGLELAFDERERAEFMSYLFKTEHYEMVLKAGDMERVLPRLTWHLEELRVGQSYPNFYAAQLAGRFVKVVLSGTGGDELFGGYPWRYYRAAVNTDFEHYIDKYYAYWQRLIPNKSIRDVFQPVWPQVSQVWTRDLFRDVFSGHDSELRCPEDYVNHSLYFEAKTFLHGLLVVEDKLSMAHGLESRVPFLDNDLVDFALRLPVRLKLANLREVIRLNENEAGPKPARYIHKTKDGKLLLRRVMERYIPAEITNQEKQGFSAPDASWFKGESIDLVRQTVFNPRARIYEFLDPKAVQALVSGHLEGKENRRLLIWSLLNLEQWCATFLD